MPWVLEQGDCLEVMEQSSLLADNSMGALVTDPPGGIDFMKQILKWDSSRGGRKAWVEWLQVRMTEALRVCKPGAFGVVWSHQRTTHWTGWALEEAGWEVHGQIYHLYGQGAGRNDDLKPAVEPWYIVRKPLTESSELKNVARWGVGRWNIETGRVPRDRNDVPGWHKSGAKGSSGYLGTDTFAIRDMSAEEIVARCGDKDRWPSNLYLGPGGAEILEAQRKGSSRFFPQVGMVKYCPKPVREEKEAGCEALPDKVLRRVNPGGIEREPRFAPVIVKNNHNTVKPLEFMRWVIGMMFPKQDWNEWVFDPFTGSGTTGAAAIQMGYSFFGIEENTEYYDIAEKRIEFAVAERAGQMTLEDWEEDFG
jgi:DNA modification methylase